MYESPIRIFDISNAIQQKVNLEREEKVLECIREYGIEVDKEELIKALEYDRDQYIKGYNDALDKIRAEIDQKQYDFMADKDYDEGVRFGLMLAYQIIDKYKAESEG